MRDKIIMNGKITTKVSKSHDHFLPFPRSFFRESTFDWSGAGWTIRFVSLFTGGFCWWHAVNPIPSIKLASNNKLFIFNDCVIGF